MGFRRGPPSGRAGFSPREYLRALSTTFAYTPRVLGMVWQTSPGLTAGVAAITGVRALIPAATIWLTKLVIDAVVEAIANGGTDESVNRVITLVVLQLALALASTALDHGGSALRAMLGDRFSNRINIMILEKAETLDLAYFEDSTFYDMLERARREANMRPTGLVTNTFSLVGSVIQLVSVAALLGLAGLVDSHRGGGHVRPLPGRGHVVRSAQSPHAVAARPGRTPALVPRLRDDVGRERSRKSGSSTWAAICWTSTAAPSPASTGRTASSPSPAKASRSSWASCRRAPPRASTSSSRWPPSPAG